MHATPTTLASVADKVHEILEAAEATAAAIRRGAEADAARAAEAEAQRRRVRQELSHLSGLADALSVHAEAVRRQCDVVAGALERDEAASGAAAPPPQAPSGPGVGAPRGAGAAPPGHPGEAGPADTSARPDTPAPPTTPPTAVTPASSEGRVPGPTQAATATSPQGPTPADASAAAAAAPLSDDAPADGTSEPDGDSPARTAEPSAGGSVHAGQAPPAQDSAGGAPSAAGGATPAPPATGTPPTAGDAAPGSAAHAAPLPSEWLEAYRLRLAGAGRQEVEAHLRKAGAEDPDRILDEIFRVEPEQR